MQIAIASGKGGTGKTFLATNLALSLQGEGPVQLLDCDVEEPNVHLFLHPVFSRQDPVSVPVPVLEEQKCNLCGRCRDICSFNAISLLGERVLTFPELCHGCGGCIHFCPERALREEPYEIGSVQQGRARHFSFVQGKLNIGSPLAVPIIEAVKEKALCQGTVIIDAPPGTSCPVVAAVRDADFCLLVTEPTPFGLHDLDLAAQLVAALNVPAGVILNRGGEGDEIIESYCRQQGLPLLLKIPFQQQIAQLYAQGICLVDEHPQWKTLFQGLEKEMKRRL